MSQRNVEVRKVFTKEITLDSGHRGQIRFSEAERGLSK